MSLRESIEASAMRHAAPAAAAHLIYRLASIDSFITAQSRRALSPSDPAWSRPSLESEMRDQREWEAALMNRNWRKEQGIERPIYAFRFRACDSLVEYDSYDGCSHLALPAV